MTFHDVQFPPCISYGSRGGPRFKTTVLELSSGNEKRNIDWQKMRAEYDVAHGIKTKEEMDELRAFFYARRGRAYAFRFKDWGDFTLARQVIGATNGALATFQIYKRYTSGGFSYDRDLIKIVADTTRVWVNNVEIDAGAAGDEFAVNLTTGIVTIGATLAATSAQDVEVSCEFDVPVRFETDVLAASHDFYNVESWDQIMLREVRDAT